jgi:hypothetical protein
MRRTQTWYGNVHNAGSGYSCQTVMGLDQKKQYLLTSHTFGRWFSRFMRGAQFRMGMVRHQNEALKSLLLMGVCAAGEEAWRQSSSEVERKAIKDTVCFMLIAFGAGL